MATFAIIEAIVIVVLIVLFADDHNDKNTIREERDELREIHEGLNESLEEASRLLEKGVGMVNSVRGDLRNE